MNIHELQAKTTLTPDEAMTLFSHYERLMKSAGGDARTFRKLSKSAAAAAIRAFDAGVREPTALERFSQAIEQGAKTHSFPADFRKAAAKIKKALRGGKPAPETLVEKKGKVRLDCAMFCLGAPERLATLPKLETDIAQTRAGEIFYVHTGADGQYSVTLRVTSGPEPELTDTESARSEGATATAILDVASNKFACSDGDGQPQIEVDLEPGRYAVAGHLVKGEYVFVLCRSDAPVGTEATGIETLEGG
jgi:hypothetical protein